MMDTARCGAASGTTTCLASIRPACVQPRPARLHTPQHHCARPASFAPSSSSTTPQSPRFARLAPAAAAHKGFGAKPASAPKKDKEVKALDPGAQCPCGSGSVYDACCRPYHNNAKNPETPEKLLRSRYCAYSIMNASYIADTTHLDAKEHTGKRSSYINEVARTQKRMKCVGLEIQEQEPGAGPLQHFITFKLSYYDRDEEVGKLYTRVERSQFVKQGPKWLFLDSEFVDTDKKEEK